MSEALKKRGRKLDSTLPPSRSRDVQRAFRARRAAHLHNLEARNVWLEQESMELRKRLGLDPGVYLTSSPPAKIDPDYERVGRKGKRKGAVEAQRTQETSDDGQGGDEVDWSAMFSDEQMESLRGSGSGDGLSAVGDSDHGRAEPLASNSQGYPSRTTPSTSSLSFAPSTSHAAFQTLSAHAVASLLLPTPPPSLPRYHTPQSSRTPTLQQQAQQDLASYGVYFVPKGQNQASFVGTTCLSPETSTSLLPAQPYTFSQSRSHHHSRPLPSSSTSTFPNFPSPIPTPSTGNLRLPFPYPTPSSSTSSSTQEQQDGEFVMKTFHSFLSSMHDAFDKGQGRRPRLDRMPSTDSPFSTSSNILPLPLIRLPRFNSSLPNGSSSSTSSSQMDTYLHITSVFQRLAVFLLPPHPTHPSNSSAQSVISPSRLVALLRAQEQPSLLNDPTSFNFARPPVCLEIPRNSPSPHDSNQHSEEFGRRRRMDEGDREMYVLLEAVDAVQRELDSYQLP